MAAPIFGLAYDHIAGLTPAKTDGGEKKQQQKKKSKRKKKKEIGEITSTSGPSVQIDHAFGREFPELSEQQYSLAVHCGACMLDRQKQRARITDLQDAQVPVTNYGFLLSYLQGPHALQRTLQPWGVAFDA